MEKQILISVIIPCYNDGMYLEETIQKVRAQTYNNIEIIIVNDGSTDATTREVFNKLSADTSLILLHQENGRMAAARNYGVKHAHGDIIVILDAEDYFHPSFFQKAKTILDTRPDVVAVTSYMKNFGANRKRFKPRGGTVHNFLFSNQSPACAMLRKADWNAINGYDESMKLGYEDWEFYIRLTAFTKRQVYVIPKYMFHYRQTENSTLKKDSIPNAQILIDYLVSKNADVYLSCLKELIFQKKVLYTDSRVSWQNILKMIKNRIFAKYKHKQTLP